MQVAINVQNPRQLSHLGLDLWGPLIDLLRIRALQRQLIRRARELASDLDWRRILHKGENPGHTEELAAHAVDELIHGLAALRAGLHGNEKDAGVAGLAESAAGERHHGLDSRLLEQDLVQFPLVLLHGLERNILSSQRGAEQASGIVAGYEPFWQNVEKVPGGQEQQK